MNIETCRCGAAFVMRSHEITGKPNPITAEPVEWGNIEILASGSYRIISRSEPYDGPRHASHFAECPYAKSFKRSRT
jgi:hypothetical protein